MARREKARVAYPRRGDVYLVALDPTVGYEIQKTRPGVIVQDDILNRVGGTTIIACITSNTRPPLHLTRVFVRAGEGGLRVDSVIVTRQLRVR
jgi:mRNA interferase MazF